MQSKLNTEQKNLQSKQATFQRDLYDAQNKAMSDFIEKTQSAASEVAKKHHLQIVLPRKAVLYYDNSMDVTKEVLKDMG